MSRVLRGAACLSATTLVLTACGGGQQQEDAPAQGEVVRAEVVSTSALTMGYLLPESGPLSSLGSPQIEAVKLAVADLNVAGGVLGELVTLLPGDEGFDEAIALQSAEPLVVDLESAEASVSDVLLDDPDASSYVEDIEQVLRGRPEAVVIIGREESAEIIRPLLPTLDPDAPALASPSPSLRRPCSSAR